MSRYAPTGPGVAVGQVYIQGLPPSVTEAQIKEHFSQIGGVKVSKKTGGDMIHIYREANGKCKGDATLTYEDPDAAPSAVEFFNGQPMGSSTLKVSVASRGGEPGAGDEAGAGPSSAAPPAAAPSAAAPSSYSSGGGGGGGGYGGGGGGYGGGGGGYGGGGGSSRGGYGGGGGGGPGANDWPCPNCQNLNFARRTECNKCRTPKDGAAAGGGGGYGGPPAPGGGAPFGGGGGRGGGAGFADWACPNCQNVNFARRTECNKCHTPKDAAGGGGGGYGAPPGYGAAAPGYGAAAPGYGAPGAAYAGAVAGAGAEGGYGAYGAPGYGGSGYPATAPPPPAAAAPAFDAPRAGPAGPGAFKEGDWPCGGCGNVNWARRDTCNTCGRKKGPSEVRTGAGGGFSERQDRVSSTAASGGAVDGYDDFGRRVKSGGGGGGGGDWDRGAYGGGGRDESGRQRGSRSRSRERGAPYR